MKSKWLVPILPYMAVWAGLFMFKNAWAALLGFHATILLVIVLQRPQHSFSIFFQNANKKLFFFTVWLCSLSGLSLYILRNFLGIASDLRAQLADLGLHDNIWIWFISYFSIINPLLEEYFWRAMLGSDTRSFYLGDLIYAGYHVMVVWNKTSPMSIALVILALTFIGWFWRQLYRKDGSLLTPVISHAVADLSILLAAFFMVNPR